MKTPLQLLEQELHRIIITPIPLEILRSNQQKRTWWIRKINLRTRQYKNAIKKLSK